ncbi:MAG TPA: helix-turn-helix domain-containing protein [Ktedonobacteraceae bacterium]
MDQWLTIAKVARRLRVDPTAVRRWIIQGSLPAVILPGHGSRHAIEHPIDQSSCRSKNGL